MKYGFREIADDIRAKIVNGTFRPGDTLPPEPRLAEEYGGVSRSLVNQAIRLLFAEGVVRPRQGDGTRVTWLPPFTHSPARYRRTVREQGGALGAFDAEVRALGLEPQHEITTERVAAPDDIAELMGLTPGQVNAVRRSRRLSASGIRVRLSTSWLPLDIAADTVLEEPAPVMVGGIKSALAELGHEQTEALERSLVRLPTPQEIEALGISPERTVFDIHHTGRTAAGRVVEVTTTVTPAHYLVIESTLSLT